MGEMLSGKLSIQNINSVPVHQYAKSVRRLFDAQHHSFSLKPYLIVPISMLSENS